MLLLLTDCQHTEHSSGADQRKCREECHAASRLSYMGRKNCSLAPSPTEVAPYHKPMSRQSSNTPPTFRNYKGSRNKHHGLLFTHQHANTTPDISTITARTCIGNTDLWSQPLTLLTLNHFRHKAQAKHHLQRLYADTDGSHDPETQATGLGFDFPESMSSPDSRHIHHLSSQLS